MHSIALKIRQNFLPLISLILFSPGFTNDIERDSVSFEYENLISEEADSDYLEIPFFEDNGKEIASNESLQSEQKPPKAQKIDPQKLSALEKLVEKERKLIEHEKALIAKKKQLLEKERELLAKEKQEEDCSLAPMLAKEEPQEKFIADVNPSFPSQPNKNFQQPRLENCESPFHTLHVGLRHTEARGVGYKNGYTTLEGFGIYDRNATLMPFIDLRGHVFDHGKLAGNVGIGLRSYLASFHHVLGVYCYYDVRQDTHKLTPQQVSPGIELLGKRLEYRMNGYFPVGTTKSHKYNFNFDEFDGHSILLKSKQRFTMTGGDAEIGAHLTQTTDFDVYAGVGPYYFTSSHTSAWGGKVRVLGRYKQYVSLEASYSYDHLFGNIVQGTIALNMPFGSKIKLKKNNCAAKTNLALSRAAFSPYRFEIPVVKRVVRKEKAINPATDAPWRVWFVNNTSSSAGTFESPFPTLIQAQNASAPNDIIYVFQGDGTTTGMDAGITLKDAQKLLGAGITHHISTTKGKIKIPAFSNGFPQITNLGGSVIILANANEVSGMSINMVGLLTGINGSNINTATIDRNTFSGQQGRGIVLLGYGNVEVTDNTFIANPLTMGIQAVRLTLTPSQTMTGIASGNTISGFINGIGMNFLDNSTAIYEISDNEISDSTHNAIYWGMPIGGSGTSFSKGVISRNRLIAISGSTALEVFDNLNDSMNGSLQINDNFITTDVNGIDIRITGPSNFICNLQNNQVEVSGVGFFGIRAQTIAPGAPNLCISLLNNHTNTIDLTNNDGMLFLGPISGNTGVFSTSGVTVGTESCSE